MRIPIARVATTGGPCRNPPLGKDYHMAGNWYQAFQEIDWE
jgi:hypothetical protein